MSLKTKYFVKATEIASINWWETRFRGCKSDTRLNNVLSTRKLMVVIELSLFWSYFRVKSHFEWTFVDHAVVKLFGRHFIRRLLQWKVPKIFIYICLSKCHLKSFASFSKQFFCFTVTCFKHLPHTI